MPVSDVLPEFAWLDGSEAATAPNTDLQDAALVAEEPREDAGQQATPDWDKVWQQAGDLTSTENPGAIAGDAESLSAADVSGEKTPEETAAVAAADEATETPSAIEKPPELPKTLSNGWPDESAWSQSFVWPAMKQPPGVKRGQLGSGSGGNDEGRADVSDIVAQVKAELEAARRGDVPMPRADWGDVPDLETEKPVESADSTAAETGPPPAEPSAELDEDARREEVSRLVAEMRGQIEAAGFEDRHPNGRQSNSAWRDSATSGAAAVDGVTEPPAEQAKPAFRLAAPGSLPDWAHMSMEPSGPPMVVMKDADGRVELASVYETLNELGCGDGAALLNYTPHSVTVGLAMTAKVPTNEDMAAAVEKVFGLASRVESDGIRLTVNIGAGPKKRNEDAA
jgi:hypothetical protein